jgi:hypothetical protein
MLCGPFQAARVLREAGIERWDGEPLDQDLVALRAGTLLPDPPPERSVPPGADSLLDYRYELPVAPPSAPAPRLGAWPTRSKGRRAGSCARCRCARAGTPLGWSGF